MAAHVDRGESEGFVLQSLWVSIVGFSASMPVEEPSAFMFHASSESCSIDPFRATWLIDSSGIHRNDTAKQHHESESDSNKDH